MTPLKQAMQRTRHLMTHALATVAMTLFVSVAIAGDDLRITSALRAAGVSAEEAGPASRGALANRDGSAIAVAIPRKQHSLVLVLLRQPSGEYRAVDVSSVEDGNIGTFGFPRSRCERIETQPVEWLPRDDGMFQVVFRTRAWKAGQRYSASEPLVLRADGTPIWR